MPVPSTIPVIVLADCNILPHALLPLSIFEPRYRALLDTALRQHRFMGVATLRHADSEPWDESDDNIEPYSCAGLLRVCVGSADGTSRLVLQGVRRVRLVEWEQREPFRIARVERVPSVVDDEDRAYALAEQVFQRARRRLPPGSFLRRQLDEQFSAYCDPCLLADVVAYHFVPEARQRQPLLELTSVEERLLYLLRCLPEN